SSRSRSGSGSQGLSAYAASAASRISAAGSFIAFAQEASSCTGSGRNAQATIGTISPSTPTLDRAGGSSAAQTADSNRPAGQDASPAVRHGLHALMNSATDSALMYSPLNARSFLTSKNAGDGLTSSIRNSATISSNGTISRSPRGAQPSSMR